MARVTDVTVTDGGTFDTTVDVSGAGSIRLKNVSDTALKIKFGSESAYYELGIDEMLQVSPDASITAGHDGSGDKTLQVLRATIPFGINNRFPDGIIVSGSITTEPNDNIVLLPGGTGYTRIGDLGTPTACNTNDDLYVGNVLEVNKTFYPRHHIEVGQNKFITRSSAVGALQLDNSYQTNNSPMLLTGNGSNAYIVCEYGDFSFDFAHSVQTNPTLFIHSANQATDEWLGTTHDQTDGVISTGSGDLYLNPAANVKFGTHSALGGETVTGYITINDSGGTPRKLAVVS